VTQFRDTTLPRYSSHLQNIKFLILIYF